MQENAGEVPPGSMPRSIGEPKGARCFFSRHVVVSLIAPPPLPPRFLREPLRCRFLTAVSNA